MEILLLRKVSGETFLLEEENAVALKCICAVTHSRSQMIPEDLSVRDIIDIAIVADKYDLLTLWKWRTDPGFVFVRKSKQETWLSWLQHMCLGMRKLSDRLLRLSLWTMPLLTLTFIPIILKR